MWDVGVGDGVLMTAVVRVDLGNGIWRMGVPGIETAGMGFGFRCMKEV